MTGRPRSDMEWSVTAAVGEWRQQGRGPVKIVLGRIVALLYRSSSVHHVH